MKCFDEEKTRKMKKEERDEVGKARVGARGGSLLWKESKRSKMEGP